MLINKAKLYSCILQYWCETHELSKPAWHHRKDLKEKVTNLFDAGESLTENNLINKF